MQGVSYYHVHLEAWMGGYAADWEYIQTTYSSMAPQDLGSMGYPGFVTMYLPRSIQNHAYSTKGKALQFFRSWNASWNQPWDFFHPISAVDTSKLLPCNSPDSKMTSDPLLRRYVKWTGDIDGVVISNESRLPCSLQTSYNFTQFLRRVDSVVVEGSLEVKLPTIWKDEAAEVGRGREEKESEEKKSEKRKSQERRSQRRERVRRKKIKVREKKSRETLCLSNVLWLQRVEK